MQKLFYFFSLPNSNQQKIPFHRIVEELSPRDKGNQIQCLTTWTRRKQLLKVHLLQEMNKEKVDRAC